MLSLKARSLAARFGLRVALGWGSSAGEALVRARVEQTGLPQEGGLSARLLIDFVRPFGAGAGAGAGAEAEADAVLQRVVEQMIFRLRKLGVSNVDEWLTIPRSEFAVRFGKIGLEFAQALTQAVDETGHVPELWPKLILETDLEEELEIDSSEQLESVLFMLRTVLDRVMARLRGRAERLARMNITLECERYWSVREPKRDFEIACLCPQGSAAGVLRLVSHRLDHAMQVQPLESPVCRIRVRVLEAVPGRGAQSDFFDRREHEEQEMETLLGDLMDRVGIENVFVPERVESPIPERAWRRERCQSLGDVFGEQKQGSSFGSPFESASVLRPNRLWSEPIPLELNWETLQERTRFPERIVSHWWEQPVERDYYRVRTASGEELWIFLTPDRSVFWHGSFD